MWLDTARQVFRYLFTMLEEKNSEQRALSMTRGAVAAFTVVTCVHIWRADTLTWPDAALAFVVLFALPISKSIFGASANKVVEAVTGMFGDKDSRGRYSHARPTDPTYEP